MKLGANRFMSLIHHLWEEIRRGENIELYLIVAASSILLVLDLFGFAKPEWIFSVNIAVLALLAISLLGNRNRLEKLQQNLNQPPNSLLHNKYPENMRLKLSQAQELWIFGIMLTRTINEYYDVFSENIQDGRKIKFLIIEPDGKANGLAAYRLTSGMDGPWHRTTVLKSIGLMCRLKEQSPSNVDIRTIDYVPSFGFFGVDIDARNGLIFAEHYGFKLRAGDRPKIILHPQDNPGYELFRDQMDALWNHGKKWQYGVEETDDLLLIKSDADDVIVSEATDLKKITHGRQRLDLYKSCLQEARQEILIVATAVRNLSQDTGPLSQALSQDKRIRLLMLDPDYLDAHPDIAQQIEKTIGIEDVYHEVKASIDRFHNFIQEQSINFKEPDQFQLRFYSKVPTIGMVITDANQEESKMFFELFPYQTHAYNRPGFVLEPSSENGINAYRQMLEAAEEMWNDARSLE